MLVRQWQNSYGIHCYTVLKIETTNIELILVVGSANCWLNDREYVVNGIGICSEATFNSVRNCLKPELKAGGYI